MLCVRQIDQFKWVIACCLIGSMPWHTARGQDDLASKRAWLDRRHRNNLDALAAKCDELKLTEQARITRDWFIPRDEQRQYIFLPQESDSTKPLASAPRLVQFWHSKFVEHRQQHAQSLYELARKALQMHDPTRAYQLLHEALHEDPDHAQARRILGYTKVNGRWRRPGAQPRSRTQRTQQRMFGWPPRTYQQVETEHFQITTNHSSREGIQLGQRLETLYDVWKQLYFRFWSNEQQLARWFNGPVPVRRASKKYKVVMFRSRDEYVSQLTRFLAGVENSEGVYLNDQKTSFVYAGDKLAEDTWMHEATHQLFQETGTSVPKVGQSHNAWVIEGIAMYMESMTHHDGYCIVGGFDAPRMQFARYQALNNRRYVPSRELVLLSRDALQADEKRSMLYAQSAGLAHFLMDFERGAYQEALVDYLRAVYDDRVQPDSLLRLTKAESENLDSQYQAFLAVTNDEVATYLRSPEFVTQLSLGHTSVDDTALAMLTTYSNLQWLDLAFTKITDQGLIHLRGATNLRDLNLEGTQVTDDSMPLIGQWSSLEELDLSNTRVTDDGLAHLTKLSQLKTVWLTGTAITNDGLNHLKALKQLEMLEISGTQATSAGFAELKRSLPLLNN